jgi:hypothetical protein
MNRSLAHLEGSMKANWKFFLVLTVLFGAAWSTTTALGPQLAGRRFRQAMELVRSDGAHLVCEPPRCDVSPSAHTLLVLFSPRDCSIGLYQTAVADSLVDAVPRGRLNVLGVAYGMRVDEVRKFRTASGIRYPVYADAERFERAFGSPKPATLKAPVLVLLDARGTVLETHAAGGSIRAHHRYPSSLARHWQEAP